MKITAVSINEWMYPDTLEYASAAGTATLHAPRGGYAATQVLVTGANAGQAIQVEFTGDLPFEAYQLLDVCVDRNTGAHPGEPKPEFATRQAPFHVYDALRPLSQGRAVTERSSAALYFAWPIPGDAVPGVRTGRVTVTIGGETVALPVSIMVHKAALPAKERLKTTNWYPLGDSRQGYVIGDTLPEPFSQPWYVEYTRMLKLMRRTRQTHIFLPLDAVKVSSPGEGQYVFDFSAMERMIRIALDLGFQYLELGHLVSKDHYGAENFYLFHQPGGRKINVVTPEGQGFLAQFLPRWTGFLKKNGWYDISVQHFGDEANGNQVTEALAILDTIRGYMPGMAFIDAFKDERLAGPINICVLLNEHYQLDKAMYDAKRSADVELWHYTCCGPQGYWLNRFLDGDLLRPRLLHYGNYIFDLPGYLHWGFSYYPFDFTYMRKEGTAAMNNDPNNPDRHHFPAGDAMLIYPGEGDGPYMSARGEMMRCGCEDYELLLTLSQHDKARADGLCRAVVRDFTDYTADVKAFEENYVKLLEAVDAL